MPPAINRGLTQQRECSSVLSEYETQRGSRVVATSDGGDDPGAAEAAVVGGKFTEALPFREGDAVVYPTHGVGKVESVGFEEIAGQQLNLIRVSLQAGKMTLRVPVARARAVGLRRLATKEMLAAALEKLKGRPRTSPFIWARRSQECLAKIHTGDPAVIAEVVRDLQSHDDGSESSLSQRNLFELALERLAAELAAVERIAKSEAIARITQILAERRKSRPVRRQGSVSLYKQHA